MKDDTVLFSAVTNLNGGVVASFHAFPNAVEVSEVVRSGSDDVIVADHSVR